MANKILSDKRITNFAKVVGEVDQKKKAVGHVSGPLEAFEDADDRFIWRMSQAQSLLTLLGHERVVGAFSELNECIQMDIISCVEQLVSAAYVDARIAISEARSASAAG